MELPDHMPEGCNFFGLLRTALPPEALTQKFAAAGWRVVRSGDQELLEIEWGRLVILPASPVVIQGWLDRPDDRVGGLLGLLQGREIDGVYQWINGAGQLWRELPFDDSMLDPDDPRLPPDLKASILVSKSEASPAAKSRKPWWRFW